MSRVIVKNLPLNVNEDKLRQHFGKCQDQQLTVTDAKLMKTKEGKSRRFAFIGYKTEEEAMKVVSYYDKTFIGSTRIEVNFAKSSRDAPIPKKRLFTEQEQRTEKKRKTEEVTKGRAEKKLGTTIEEPRDEKLQAYLEAMKPLQNQKSWVNDDIIMPVEPQSTTVKDPESDVEYDDVPVVKSTKTGFSEGKIDSNLDEEEQMIPFNSKENDLTENSPEGLEGSQETADLIAKDENVPDLEWLRMRQERIVEKEEIENNNGNDDHQAEDRKSESHESNGSAVSKQKRTKEPEVSSYEKNKLKIAENKRLFIRNLAYSSNEDDFKDLFSRYGDLEEVHLPIDTRSGKPKGFAYVLFQNGDDAVNAYESLDGRDFQGRLLHILPADSKKENKLDEFDLKDLPLKKQKELRRKFAASKQQFSWNSLYLNPDAVMESVASKLGVSKSDLLNADSADSAVQRAIAESSVINNVKQYFESKGINLDMFGKTERSDLVILVKNFPFDTSVEEITDLFAQHGELSRVLMPPDGGIAMVVFKYAPEARAAFTKLAYRRFKSSVLYLEKGPKGLFEEDDSNSTTSSTANIADKPKTAKISASDILETAEEKDEDVYTGPTVSLFVKNLSFSTTTQDLTNAFKSIDGFASAKVQVKPDANNSGKALSMGFGFVEFRSKEAAELALSLMDGHSLDGHKLQLKISHRGQDAATSSSSTKLDKAGKPKNKIIIKNLPFETTKKDVQKLISTFGQLKSLRVPRKFNKAARGFAFAEFVTSKDAENTMKALQGTHLLGRRLVMEYAEQDAENADEEIARMEAKVQKQVTQQTLQGLKLTGKRGVDIEEELGTNEDFD